MTAFSCCGFLSAQEAHDWTVNVNDYMFNQPLVAFVQIDGEYVTTTGYEVGAFVDGNLRGAAEMAAYSGDSHPIVEMPVYYSAANDQDITFKLYDKATEQVLECETTIALGAAHVELYSDETQAVVLNFITPQPAVTIDDGNDLSALSTYAGQTVDVTYTREFTSGKTSTVCLPFAYKKQEGDGSFYAFTNIEKEGSDYVATMTEPSATTLTANTPYLYVPNATGAVDFSGTYAIPASLTAGSTTSNDWTFKGTFETIEWENAPTGTYGFSAQGVDEDGIGQGEFVQVGEFVKINPMRCYLQYKDGTEDYAGARAAEQLPATIKVRLVSASGEVNGIGRLNIATGEATFGDGAWYSLDGRRVQTPTKGVYVKNGHKVVIK